MFCKATLVTVALGLLAAATPVVQNTNGVRIPLRERATLTKEDGTFDHDKAVLHNIQVHKYVSLLRAPPFPRF